MSRRKTPYELVLPGRTPDEVKAAISRHKSFRGSRGLRIRIRGERVKATVSDNTLAEDSSTPLLKAWVSQDSRGARIDGMLHWSSLVKRWGEALFGLVLVAGSAYGLSRPGIAWYAVALLALPLLGGIWSALSAVTGIRKDDQERARYVATLNRELEVALRKRG